MIRDDVIYLVDEEPRAHGIFDQPEERRTMCYCKVASVGRAEFWRALQNGIEPSLVFVLSEYADYQGQKLLIYNGKRYRVVRSYVTEHAVELTAAEATADAGETDCHASVCAGSQ